MLLERKPLMKSEVKLFGTAKSFYKMTSYMMRNGLIEAETLDKNRKRYSLTFRGELLANILNTLTDAEELGIEKFLVPPTEGLWSR